MPGCSPERQGQWVQTQRPEACSQPPPHHTRGLGRGHTASLPPRPVGQIGLSSPVRGGEGRSPAGGRVAIFRNVCHSHSPQGGAGVLLPGAWWGRSGLSNFRLREEPTDTRAVWFSGGASELVSRGGAGAARRAPAPGCSPLGTMSRSAGAASPWGPALGGCPGRRHMVTDRARPSPGCSAETAADGGAHRCPRARPAAAT